MRALLASLVVVTGLFAVTIWLTLRHLGNTILPGVSVQAVDVGGLTVAEAATALARVLPAPETLGVNVQVAGQVWPISWADAGQQYDIHATVEAAYRVGRDADAPPSLAARLRRQNVIIEPVLMSADPSLITAAIAQIAAAVERVPVNAQFAFDASGIITATVGQPGQRLDPIASASRVLWALAEGTPTVELTVFPVAPLIAEPEPAYTQARVWLARPFTLTVDMLAPDTPENALAGSALAEFIAPVERVSVWLEPRVEGQGIVLHVMTAPVEVWVEEIASQVAPTRALAITETTQNILAAFSTGQSRAEAQLRPPTSFYLVQLGDTLLDIALNFRITVRAIKAFNNLESDLIIAGQKLLIPSTFTPEVMPEVVVSDTPALIVDTSIGGVPSDFPVSHSVHWRTDLETLVTQINELPQIHPGGFSVVYDEAFTGAVAALDPAISTLADHQIVVGMMQILAMLGDAHTGVNLYQWAAFQERVYPIQLQWFSDGLFVTAVQPGYEELLRLELVQVGGVSISQVLGRLARIIPHENVYRVRAASTNYIIRPVILHALGLAGDLTRASFVFQNGQGDNLTRSLVAGDATAMQTYWIQAVPPRSAPLYLQKSQDQGVYYWYTYIESARVLYFQFNRCAEQPQQLFGEFLEEMSGVVAARPIEKYIIDLRHNAGGIPGMPDLIISFLEARPQLTQRNRLLVLTGNRTFSAAVYFTSLLQQQFKATLVGEPTGQGNNFYASPGGFVLPHSGLVVNHSYEYWQFAPVSSKTIEPDIMVELSSRDYFAGNDPVLDRALAQP
jgi:LysM repeat protein